MISLFMYGILLVNAYSAFARLECSIGWATTHKRPSLLVLWLVMSVTIVIVLGPDAGCGLLQDALYFIEEFAQLIGLRDECRVTQAFLGRRITGDDNHLHLARPGGVE
jgi:hypothetical protein